MVITAIGGAAGIVGTAHKGKDNTAPLFLPPVLARSRASINSPFSMNNIVDMPKDSNSDLIVETFMACTLFGRRSRSKGSGERAD